MIDLYVELLIRPQHMVFLVSDDFKNKIDIENNFVMLGR